MTTTASDRSIWNKRMSLVFKRGAVEVWAVAEDYGVDYYVYGVARDPIVCPSLSMARAKATA